MSIDAETNSGKDAAISGTVRILRRSGLARVVYDHNGGTIFRLLRDPFPDDPMRSLHLRAYPGKLLAGGVRLVHVRFIGAKTRLKASLFVPPGTRRRPGVLFLAGPGDGGRRLYAAAAQLAHRGAVALMMTQPRGVNPKQAVVEARRALDVLAKRTDVDIHRLGVVGASTGGQTAAVLSGVDLRVKTVGLIDTHGTPAALHWIRHTQAHLFFQAGLRNTLVRPAALERLVGAAPGRPRVRWYLAGGGPNPHVYADQVTWQARILKAR
jgi:dienelactone hydrolase